MAGWRYRIGRKGVSRVTVFERPDATSIFVEWWDDGGRHRAALSEVVGHPVTDREVAEEIARRMSSAQERKRNQQAAEMLGIPTARTLKELLDQRHADLKPAWSSKYAKSRERRKAFWLDKLGDARLTHVRPSIVERIAREAQAEKGLSDRWRQDVLRYLVDSFIYAEKKLKWIEPRHNLSAVTMPRAKGRGVPYTLEEAQKLLPKLWQVHPVAGWLGHVVFQGGRRIGAARQIKPEHVKRSGRWSYIEFPSDTDKAGNATVAAILDLPERTDWTVPTAEVCNQWIHDAEDLAGVEHVEGRGWHGLKRLYAELAEGLPGADLQSATRRDTLSGIYRPNTLPPKMEVAEVLAGRLAGQ